MKVVNMTPLNTADLVTLVHAAIPVVEQKASVKAGMIVFEPVNWLPRGKVARASNTFMANKLLVQIDITEFQENDALAMLATGREITDKQYRQIIQMIVCVLSDGKISRYQGFSKFRDCQLSMRPKREHAINVDRLRYLAHTDCAIALIVARDYQVSSEEFVEWLDYTTSYRSSGIDREIEHMRVKLERLTSEKAQVVRRNARLTKVVRGRQAQGKPLV